MPFWSRSSSGTAGNPGSPHGPPPPLPPRNQGHGHGHGPSATPNVIPPPIPPRPAGFGYQPVRSPEPGSEQRPVPMVTGNRAQLISSPAQDGRAVTSMVDQPAAPGHGSQQYSPLQPIPSPNWTQGHGGISHFFPDGKIPPPPPMPARPEVGINPQSPTNATSPDASVSQSAFQSQTYTNDRPPSVYSQGGQPGSQTQEAHRPQPATVSGQAGDNFRNPPTMNTTTHDVNSNSAAEANVVQEANRPMENHDMTVMNHSFQTMKLANSVEATPLSSRGENTIGNRDYLHQHPPSPAPPVPRKEPLAAQQSQDAHSPPPPPATTNTPATPKTKPPHGKVSECMSSPVTFASTWHAHRLAPAFLICANCYEAHIRGTRFAGEFPGTFFDDGLARVCRFETARMQDALWASAQQSGGSLDAAVLDYMTLRPTIPDCAGAGGAKGTAGIAWYVARDAAVPGMVACRACVEDQLLVYPDFAAAHFEPCTAEHAADQTWSCDMAVPYIQREYKARAAADDWPAFVASVPVRLSLRPCPGTQTVYPAKQWFTPVGGPRGLLICVACYCDYVLLTGQEGRWMDAGADLYKEFGVSVSCFIGAQTNVKILALQTLRTEDWGLFWRAFEVACREPTCGRAMTGATWYTLRSDPAGFEICRACHAAIAEPLGVGHHFIPKPGAPPEGGVTCSFHPAVARFASYMEKLLVLVYTQDAGPLEAFVRTYALMPQCRRDAHVEGTAWHGWDECRVCPECHHEFVRGTALAAAMPNRGVRLPQGTSAMCEMYSPRMRALYASACAAAPPDPGPLLAYSLRRRAVWAETMPRVRQICGQIRTNIFRQNMALQNSMFYSFSGSLWQNTLPSERTYGGSALGSGHYNHMQVKGAEYGRQATAIGNEIRGAPAHVADELERQWRAVE